MSGAPTPPRAETVVDLDAVAHNIRLLAAGTAPGAELMAVVKADGYGHGAVPVGRAALDAGATWLGVCSLDEAAELRAAGVRAPVLSWLVPVDEDRAGAIAGGVDLTVASLEELDAVVAGARRAGRRARVHLKIDTGLSRNGCPPEEWGALLAAVAEHAEEVEPWAVWSHLAHADEPRHPTLDRQAARLDDAWRAATTHLGHLGDGSGLRRHLANSAATLTRPDLHHDLVRPGIAVYGLDPVEEPAGVSPGAGLRPAMTFRSRVVLVKRVAAGEGVSYGHEWTTPGDRVLALVPVGYADGVPRGLGGLMSVQVAGARRPVVGRVCMDQVVVDCGPADGAGAAAEVRVGDTVLLFGPGDRGEPTATDWAADLGTIHYEIVTGVGDRPRVTRTLLAAGRDGGART